MGRDRNRRRDRRPRVRAGGRTVVVEPTVETRVRSIQRPPDTRPATLVPPGESRYRKAGGLRTRLAVASAEGTDIRITIDLTELRRRTVR